MTDDKTDKNEPPHGHGFNDGLSFVTADDRGDWERYLSKLF